MLFRRRDVTLPSIGNYKKNHNKKSSIDFGEVYCYKDLIKLSIFSLLFNKTIVIGQIAVVGIITISLIETVFVFDKERNESK